MKDMNYTPGYDPDNYDDEPSDYVNSAADYPADDLSRDSEDELIDEEDDGDLSDDDVAEEVDEYDDSDVADDDAVNDDVTDYPTSETDSLHGDRKPVYIQDMPYIDHATPGITSH